MMTDVVLKKTFTVLLVSFVLICNTAKSQYAIPGKMKWWYDDRFGMFIHFGSYSCFGHGEWVMYNEKWEKEAYQEQITRKFNPANFDAKTIVDLAKTAGMKYIVITAKHHEGFAMWRTEVAGFSDVTGSKIYDLYHFLGFERDLLMELKNECDRQGIKFCLYYSILDWNHPSQKAENYYSVISSLDAKREYVEEMNMQLKELVTRYKPAVLWFDGDWCKNLDTVTLGDWWNKADAEQLYSYLMSLDSSLIINERVKRDLVMGDFSCPEQKIPDTALARPWETCQTMNGSWGYDARDTSFKPVSRMIHELVQVVSRDGNYLLNVGPKGDGSLQERLVPLLTSIGDWMKTNGESIYGATRSPFHEEPPWGLYTKKNGKLFVHVFQWPEGGQLSIPLIKNKIIDVYVAGKSDKKLAYTVGTDSITITLPLEAPDDIDGVVEIEVDGVPEAAD